MVVRLQDPESAQVQIRGKGVAGAFSTKAIPSGGLVFRSAGLGPRELTTADFQGAIVFVEAAVGLIAGASGDAMLFGINPVLLMAGAASPVLSFLTQQAIDGAKGAVVFGGLNVGVQAGGGVAGLVGYMA